MKCYTSRNVYLAEYETLKNDVAVYLGTCY